MSRASALGAVRWDVESAFAEDVDTFTYRAASLDEVDVSSLVQTKIPAARTVQRLQDGTMPIRGVMGGSFRLRLWLAGHGSSTSGATATTDLARLLGYVIGNTAVASSSGTAISGGASTTTNLTVSAATGFSAGSIGFLGALGDGRGNGQAFVVSSHAASAIALLNAMGGAAAAADVVYSSEMIFPFEDPAAATVSGLRFHLATANQQYVAHGCTASSVSFTGLAPGDTPAVEIVFEVAWWEPVASTFPVATTQDVFNPAPIAAGSLFLQATGTTTRATYSIRDFKLTYTLGIARKRGPEGVNAFQDVIDAARIPSQIMVEIAVDAQTASTSPTWPGRWDSDTQFYHLLYSCNGAASGKQLAIYCPRLCMSDEKPTQVGAALNQERLKFQAYTGGTTTTDLTASAIRFALG